jgi:hypothetical protein
VELELELVDNYRGSAGERLRDHLRVTVQQANGGLRVRDRPEGAWWEGEQELAPDRELLAFCPEAGELASQLQASCTVHMAAADQIGDLEFARDVEREHMDVATLVAKARARCDKASNLLAEVVWQRYGDQAGKDLAVFDEIEKLLEEPTCSYDVRTQLLDRMYSAVTLTEDPPRTRSLARAMFRLLAMSAQGLLQDGIVEPLLPNLLGLNGGMHALSVADILDADARKTARTVLARYKGRSNSAPLRAWLAR